MTRKVSFLTIDMALDHIRLAAWYIYGSQATRMTFVAGKDARALMRDIGDVEYKLDESLPAMALELRDEKGQAIARIHLP